MWMVRSAVGSAGGCTACGLDGEAFDHPFGVMSHAVTGRGNQAQDDIFPGGQVEHCLCRPTGMDRSNAAHLFGQRQRGTFSLLQSFLELIHCHTIVQAQESNVMRFLSRIDQDDAAQTALTVSGAT